VNPQPVILGAVKVMSVSERQKGEIMQREWRKLTGVLATLTYAQGRAGQGTEGRIGCRGRGGSGDRGDRDKE